MVPVAALLAPPANFLAPIGGSKRDAPRRVYTASLCENLTQLQFEKSASHSVHKNKTKLFLQALGDQDLRRSEAEEISAKIIWEHLLCGLDFAEQDLSEFLFDILG